ncbi:hypothetical protein A6R68_13246 [Neotoma lepida]|uniref:non-specific serine/threonine protein kinase n=1 Tax=Neotoma lepida TaxID=56216 RepID=A0A1A6H3K4_NEOLE|nr:hypothetical protein A6R68_13246 [Neotoma lepida]
MEQGREIHSSAEETFAADFQMMTTLGRGHFSEVKLALHIPTETYVAVKMIRNKKKYASLIDNEVSVMQSLDYPYIIKLFHVVEMTETIYLVMEHASQGELYDRILKLGALEESEAKRFFTQILYAVKYCHEHLIVHRDIKADNILIDCRGNAKLADFGLAAKVSPDERLKGFYGTLPYCAPELFGKEAYDGRPTDIWSLGVLLFFMVAGHLPFWDNSAERLRQQILSGNFRVPYHVSMDIFDVICEMLIINPGRRPTIGQIMKRPMVRNSKGHLPSTSTQFLPGTLSPRIVRPMTVTGYKYKEMSESLRDQKYNQVMATYLILQYQSPRGDRCHHHEKPIRPIQPGLALNLADLHGFPVPLRRATEPAPSTFTSPSETQRKQKEMNTRQGGRHGATLCCQPKRTHPPHLAHLDYTMADPLMGSSQETENITYSKIGETNRQEQALTQEASSTQEATIIIEALIQDANIIPEATMTRADTITLEKDVTLDIAMTHEETITHGQPQDAGPASSQTRRRHRWKRVKKTILNCLRHICCCCCLAPPTERSHASCTNLAPNNGDPGVTHRTRSIPVGKT